MGGCYWTADAFRLVYMGDQCTAELQSESVLGPLLDRACDGAHSLQAQRTQLTASPYADEHGHLLSVTMVTDRVTSNRHEGARLNLHWTSEGLAHESCGLVILLVHGDEVVAGASGVPHNGEGEFILPHLATIVEYCQSCVVGGDTHWRLKLVAPSTMVYMSDGSA